MLHIYKEAHDICMLVVVPRLLDSGRVRWCDSVIGDTEKKKESSAGKQ